MLRLIRPFLISLAGLLLGATMLGGLVAAGPRTQPDPGDSTCGTGLQKWAQPGELNLGDTAKVTLLVTHTCASTRLPMDMVIVFDESNSMTRGTTGGGGDPGPDPGKPGEPGVPTADPGTPDPGGDPGGGGGGGSSGGGSDRAGCSGNDAGGGGGGGGGVTPLKFSEEQPDQPGPGPRRRTATPTPTPTPAEKPTEIGGGSSDEPPGTEDLIREEKQFVRDFLDRPEVDADLKAGLLKVGVVSFNSERRTLSKLSSDKNAITRTFSQLRGQSKSRVDLGLTEAVKVLNGVGRSGSNDQRQALIMLISDGYYCTKDFNQAQKARNDAEIVTIAMGRGANKRALQQLATERPYALEQNDLKELMDLYNNVLFKRTGTTIAVMDVYEELAENMEIVPDSAVPAPMDVNGRKLHWQLRAKPDENFPNALLITDPFTITYDVKPLEPGLWPVSTLSQVDWLDSKAKQSNASFPNVEINVLAPTPTNTPLPTPVPTDTPVPPTPIPTTVPATNTPEPSDLYLPVAFRTWPEATPTPKPTCNPEVAEVEVIAVVDTSDSMNQVQPNGKTKLQIAVDAVQELVNALLPTTRGSNARVSIVGFNSQATLLTGLTNDRTALSNALGALPGTAGTGTYIDRGLLKALDEINGRARPDSKKHVVLVTDGKQQGGDTGPVMLAANLVKAGGTTLWSIGLGAEADKALLQAIASSPTNFNDAPSPAELSAIYRNIATLIPCP